MIEGLKNYIFPIFCLNCKKEGVWVCGKCKSSLVVKRTCCCPICRAINEFGEYCFNCKKDSFLYSHNSIFKYAEDSLIEKIIYTFKYKYVEDIIYILKYSLQEYFKKNFEVFKDIDLIIPIPLHPRRFAERGFNQAELIANNVGGFLNKDIISDIIVRNRYTEVQAKLNKGSRIKNIAGAFSINSHVKKFGMELENKDSIIGKNILLVDDVFTTGSTMQECAKILRQNGAKKIYGFTIARG